MRQRRPSRSDTLTTGEVARLMQMAPRTVSDYIDSGRLRGWKVPCAHGTGARGLARRVRRSDLVAFCSREGIPVPAGLVASRPVGLVWTVAANGLAARLRDALPHRLPVAECNDGFELGRLYDQDMTHAVIVDVGGVGTPEAMSLARSLGRCGAPRRIVAVVPEGGLDVSPLDAGYTDAVEAPVNVDALARMLEGE